MRFVATADWQLGMTAHYLNSDARPRFHQARLDAVKRIGTVAQEQGAQFVLVCGDVFESNQLDRAIVSRTFEVLRSFTVPVVLLPGNHDPLDAASIYDSPAFSQGVPPHVHVLRDSKPYEVIPGVEIVGAPWFSKHPLTDLVAAACEPLEPLSATTIRIIAGHGAVSTLNPDREALAIIDVPALREVLRAGLAHVAVLGDRHSTYKVDTGIWYPGAPEVTHRREENPGNALVIDIDDGEVQVETIPVGTWTFMTVDERLESSEDVDRFADRLRAIANKDRTGVWLRVEGAVSTALKARYDAVIEEYEHLFAYLDHWERHTTLKVIPDGHDFADLELGGFAQEALAEIVESAKGDDDKAQTAQDALSLLYRYAGGTA